MSGRTHLANELNGLIPSVNVKKLKKQNGALADENIDDTEVDKENVEVKPYIPDDLTEPEHRLINCDEIANKTADNQSNTAGFPKIRNDFSRLEPQPAKDVSKEVEDFCKLNKEMINAARNCEVESKKKGRLLSPILAAISNFNLAKKLHRENLEHNPLPDTVTDRMYKKIQMQRQQEPGLSLEDKHCATGVAWKGYSGYGPNRCTKMKVFRPKTCGYVKATEDEDEISSFDRRWRFIRQSKVTPMDLAICWDMTPNNPQDEPKRTPHIDGSNGSAAPAVFSLVHTPKNEEETPKCDGIRGCGPLFEHSTKEIEDKDYFFHRSKHAPLGSKESSIKSDSSLKKRAGEVDKNSSKSAHSEKSVKSNSPMQHIHGNNSIKSDNSDIKRRAISANLNNNLDKQSIRSKESLTSFNRAKSAYNLSEIRKRSSKTKECNNNEVYSSNIHHSTPNLSEQAKCEYKQCCKHMNRVLNRLCVACEMKNMSLSEKRPKNEYKMAFKAGIPQKNVSRSYNYVLRIPKQKTPYKLKNYVIDSLAPPFSLQKARRQEYPEHWRLATVYQHSYKPIHARKRPLLQTIFK